MLENLSHTDRAFALAFFVGGLAVLAVYAIGSTRNSDTSVHEAEQVHAVRPATVVKPLSCERLADIPGKTITTAIVRFPPNAYTPAHRHPGSVTAYVLKGAVRSRLSGGPAITYAPGETWFEPAGALHLYAENVSATDVAEILAIFVTDQDCGPLVIPEG